MLRLVLPFELRSRSRFRARLAGGEEVGVLLARGQILRGGDLLLADDGRVVEVAAAPETVSTVRARDAARCSRAPPITSAIATWRCRSGTAGCATATITCSMTWCAAWAPSCWSSRRRSSRRPAPTMHGRMTHSGHDHDHGTSAAHERHDHDARRIEPLALLRLFHLVSPALPVGAYAYSQGLEYAVHAGWVHDEASTLDWLQGLVRHGLGTLDLPTAGAAASRPGSADDAAAVQHWNVQLIAARETAELRAEERHLGSALARVLMRIAAAEAANGSSGDTAFATLFSLAAVRWRMARCDA